MAEISYSGGVVVILVITIIISLSISFICSLMEACLLSLSTANIAQISQKSPRLAATWKQFKSRIQKPIAVILIINTLAHTIGAAISGAQFDKLFGTKWILLFSVIFSLVMIQYTEILPKTLGVRYNTLLAGVSAIPMQILIRLFTPVITLIEFANRPFEQKNKRTNESIAHEISALARSAVVENELSQEQASVISGSLQMSLSKARDIMVNHNHIIFLNDTMSLTEAFLASHVHRHTRYPLLSGDNHDNIIGYINFKDLVTALHIAPENPTMTGISRPILFISQDMPVNALLKKMIRDYQHIAIVQDKNKKTIGLVTMEDVIESLVGEIEDEFDKPPEMMVMLSENRWRIGGAVQLRKVCERAFRELPETNQMIDELVKSFLHGAEPVENFEFDYHGITMKVRRVTRGYVYDIIAKRRAS